jgi:hypothetical protein
VVFFFVPVKRFCYCHPDPAFAGEGFLQRLKYYSWHFQGDSSLAEPGQNDKERGVADLGIDLILIVYA